MSKYCCNGMRLLFREGVMGSGYVMYAQCNAPGYLCTVEIDYCPCCGTLVGSQITDTMLPNMAPQRGIPVANYGNQNIGASEKLTYLEDLSLLPPDDHDPDAGTKLATMIIAAACIFGAAAIAAIWLVL